MRCFNHLDREAVSICKLCGKGLCKECAVDLGYGLACKNAHEKAVEETRSLIAKSDYLLRKNSKKIMYYPSSAFFLGFYLVIRVLL